MSKQRKHLSDYEVQSLLEAAKKTRNPERNRCILMMLFRHGLRVSEACQLQLAHLDMAGRVLHVERLKKGLSTTQPMRQDELRLLKAWLAVRQADTLTPHLFISERGQPISRITIYKMIQQCGEMAQFPFCVHPHMLRHACGYALADQGADTRLIQDYLGHRNIKHTVEYTASNPARFGRLWR
jgi:type 1 fimbriae regulatory protein FimB